MSPTLHAWSGVQLKLQKIGSCTRPHSDIAHIRSQNSSSLWLHASLPIQMGRSYTANTVSFMVSNEPPSLARKSDNAYMHSRARQCSCRMLGSRALIGLECMTIRLEYPGPHSRNYQSFNYNMLCAYSSLHLKGARSQRQIVDHWHPHSLPDPWRSWTVFTRGVNVFIGESRPRADFEINAGLAYERRSKRSAVLHVSGYLQCPVGSLVLGLGNIPRFADS